MHTLHTNPSFGHRHRFIILYFLFLKLVPEHGRPPTRDMYSLLIFPSLRHGPGITARHHMHRILIPMIIEADITIPAPRQDPSLLKIVFLLCPPRIIPKTSNQTRMEASLRI